MAFVSCSFRLILAFIEIKQKEDKYKGRKGRAS